MIEAIIFDCFGVLVVDYFESQLKKLRLQDPKKAVEARELMAVKDHYYLADQDSVKQVSALLGITDNDYDKYRADSEVKNQELFAYIVELRDKGYKTAILSNVSHAGFWRRFTIEETSRYFDTVVLSGDIGFIKPDAEAYEIAADQLCCRLDSCVMIDDREDYCEAARNLGMLAIHYETFVLCRNDLELLISQLA